MFPGSVSVFRNDFNLYHILVSYKSLGMSYSLSYHPFSSSFCFNFKPFVDIFPDLKSAEDMIIEQYKSECIMRAMCLIGMNHNEKETTFAFVTDCVHSAELPGKAPVYNVKMVEYLVLSNNYYSKVSEFESFPVSGGHFFTFDHDVSRPFPSSHSYYDPDPEFCWNRMWRKPFEQLNIQQLCITLFQGSLLSYVYQGYMICYIIKRSVLNPGVRYYARGLNENNEPGNECECEMVYSSPNGVVFTHLWRRGSAPIVWETVFSSKLSPKPQHIVKPQSFNGSKCYFDRISSRVNNSIVYCVSLLNNEKGSTEADLYWNYVKMIGVLRQDNPFLIDVIAFCINQKIEKYGYDISAKHIIDLFSSTHKDSLFTITENSINEGGNLNHKQSFVYKTKQNSMFRFNCADSLDRTNFATFFFAVYLTFKWIQMTPLFDRIALNKNYTYIWELLPVDIMDFLAFSFVKSGDIISYMYTNTPSTMSSHIRQYSSSLGEAQSDTTLAILRRVMNMMQDSQRQKLFENWTSSIPNNDMRVYMDHCHLQIISPLHSTQLFQFCGMLDSVIKNDTKEYYVLIPEQYALSAIYVIGGPRPMNESYDYIRIDGGYSIPSLSPIINELYVPLYGKCESVRYPLSIGDFRVIRITFVCDKSFFYSHKIGLEMISCHQQCFVKLMQNPDLSVFNKYENGMLNLIEDHAFSFESLQSMESLRIENGISIAQREFFALKNGFNPWIIDPRRYFIMNNGCVICQKGNKEFISTVFYPSSCFPCRLAININQHNDNYVPICQNCAECALGISLQTAEFEKSYIKTKNVPIMVPFCDLSSFSFYGPLCVSQPHYSWCSFINDSIHTEIPSIFSGGTFVFEKDCSFVFILSCWSELDHIEILLNAPTSRIDLRLYSMSSEIKSVICRSSDFQLWIGFTHPIILKQFLMSMHTSNSVDIKQIKVFGLPKPPPTICPQNISISSDILFPKDKADFTWDNPYRTQIIRMNGTGSPLLVTLENTEQFIQQINIAFYNANTFINSTKLILSTAKNSFIITPRSSFSHIHVYYIDINTTISPVNVFILPVK